MTRPKFQVGDTVESECGGRPFRSKVLGKVRDGFPARWFLVLEVPGHGEQWWPYDWCKMVEDGVIDEPDTIRNELMDGGLSRDDAK